MYNVYMDLYYIYNVMALSFSKIVEKCREKLNGTQKMPNENRKIG